MEFLASLLLLAVISMTSTLANSVLYVRPSDPPPSLHCPKPCMTLDQYAQQQERYFTAGANFVFFPGDHTLGATLQLDSLSDLTLRGRESDSRITVRCRNGAAISCVNTTRLKIEGLTFLPSSNLQQDSSALVFDNSREISLSNLLFLGRGDLAKALFRAISSHHSDIVIAGCVFEGNTGDYGGAVFASGGSNITLNGSVFTKNKATSYGGAVYASESSIIVEGALGHTTGTLSSSDISESTLNEGTQSSSDTSGSTLNEGTQGSANTDHSLRTNPALLIASPGNGAGYPQGANFIDNTAEIGGAMHFYASYVQVTGSTVVFAGNSANIGGALYTNGSRVVFDTKYLEFSRNRAQKLGGAIFANTRSLLTFRNKSSSFLEGLCDSEGSANFRDITTPRTSFAYNNAYTGGSIFMHLSTVVFERGTDIEFIHNSVWNSGGGIACDYSVLVAESSRFYFATNSASYQGSAIYSEDCDVLRITAAHFVNNTVAETAICGGAVTLLRQKRAMFENATFTGNAYGALCIAESSATFTGTTVFRSSEGVIGGGIYSRNSLVSFTGNTTFRENKAHYGAAICGVDSRILLGGVISVSENVAKKGGAFYALQTDFTFNSTALFAFNQAEQGGAMYLNSASSLTFEPHTTLTTSFNRASEYGGAVYYQDTPTQDQCNWKGRAYFTPHCFIRLNSLTARNTPFSINSYNDTAGEDGGFLYGGLLDKCVVNILLNNTYQMFMTEIITIESTDHKVSAVTSQPYQLCFCWSTHEYHCGTLEIEAFRGEKFVVSLVALAQGDALTSTLMTAKVGPTARLELNQDMQTLPSNCSSLSFTLYSTEEREEITLYPDGPCRDTGLARAVVNVTILPCPAALTLDDDKCVCEDRLRVYGAECTINQGARIMRKAGSRFWVNASYVNESYQGLILYRTCPLLYCTHKTTQITLDNPDVQCDLHRSGLLCGACAANYSLMLGSSRCDECSNTYLALLLPFAAAGIALVVFLTLLRLTVATGVINCFILYANIVQVNKNSLLPAGTRNVLTVFIAWLNLDLGFQTCFYRGMDMYAQTWLQLAFPIYIWLLIGTIIFTSRHSLTVSKLIGRNPVAVLATLLLMSYTKLLKIIIEVYSSANLDYPGNKTVTVWLKDANVPYLESKHLLLTVVMSVFLLFLFLPYTVLLLFGHKLYGAKHFYRLRPLLESYHAPYKVHTRFWTGFLLLVRCALYILFSFDSLAAMRRSLLAINITFTAIGLASATTGTYANHYTNIVEASVYLNLVVLSAAALADANSPTLVHVMLGTVFVTMALTVACHFHFSYTAKSALWLRAKARVSGVIKSLKTNKETAAPPNTATPNPQRIVTRSFVEIREPILDV